MANESGSRVKELIRHRGRARKQHDVGYLFKANGSWHVRYYTGATIEKMRDGVMTKIREQKCVKVCDASGVTKDKARGLASKYLKPLTTARGVVHSTITVAEYYESVILEWWKRNLKPSSVYGYEKNWRLYIAPILANRAISEITTVDCGNFLDSLVVRGLNGTTISHIRNTVNLIFAHAATKGVIAANPWPSAILTEKPKASKPTYKYNMNEMRDILIALKDAPKAQVAVGLAYFAALRPGEVRAVRWEDYTGETLAIKQSAWRKHVTNPKTAESIAALPVVAPLKQLLDAFRAAEGNPTSGYILRGARYGRPQNLDNFANETIKPLLKMAGITWHGYYACRRGLGTVATQAINDPQGAAGMLRHKSIDTTAQHYCGISNPDTMRAMAEFEQMWQENGMQLPAPSPVNMQ